MGGQGGKNTKSALLDLLSKLFVSFHCRHSPSSIRQRPLLWQDPIGEAANDNLGIVCNSFGHYCGNLNKCYHQGKGKEVLHE